MRQGFLTHMKRLGMYAKANVRAMEIESGGFHACNFLGACNSIITADHVHGIIVLIHLITYFNCGIATIPKSIVIVDTQFGCEAIHYPITLRRRISDVDGKI